MIVRIRENSWLAGVAARQLQTNKVAMVVGNTIHLHNTGREEFLRNKKWVRHEIAHVHQWKRFGLLRFAILYLYESFNKGYEFNRFEIEARHKESDADILANVDFL